MFDEIFSGGSEMARLMREMDWSRTSLGPVERWPQPLKTSVNISLNCAFPIVIWWGPDLTILYNDEYRTILGPAKHPSALGQPGAKVWAEIWDVIGPMLAHVVASNEATRSRDLRLNIDRHGFAEEGYFSFSYSPILDEDGKVGGIFCPVIETTQKIIGERRLRTLRDLAAHGKGAESEASICRGAAGVLQRNPLDVPFALIYSVDEKRVEAKLEATAGIEPGTPAAAMSLALEPTDEDVSRVWSLGECARSGEPAVVKVPAAIQGLLPSGAWKIPPHTALILPILRPGQELPRVILIAAASPVRSLDEDYRTFFNLVASQIASRLAEGKALEDEHRRAEALAAIDRAKTAFFSNVSHEFRTPLTLMLGPLEETLTGAHGALPEEAAAALKVAHRNSRRLLKLVNTLLDFSRIEAGRIDASYEPTDLAGCTAELASVFRSTVEKAGLRLTVDCPPQEEPAYVDRDMWEKIVLNLVSNAFKFTFEGEITVALHRREGAFELSVRDTGVGIPEADLPKVFQRFHRIKDARSRTHEGTGIGLAQVSELAKLHAGSVGVQSLEGQGTTFTVTIPAGKSHLPEEHLRAERKLASTRSGAAPFIEEALGWLPQEKTGDAGEEHPLAGIADAPRAIPGVDGRKARILIADDNADMRHYLRRLLEAGYEVEAVADGEKALEKVRERPPDLILTDVMMPSLDGFGLLAAVRAETRTRTLPVIMLSARAGEESRIEGLSAGADDYLIKPFSARELLARVASQLELARLRRETAEALQEADRRKDEFLATLAHELRNPLAPLRNSLHVLKLTKGRDPEPDKIHEMMSRQVSHMVRLVDDLMEVSRITRGKVEIRREPVTLAEIVRSAVETSRPLIEAAGHQLFITLPDEPLILQADAVRLAQVVTNLLNNAAKYTERDGRISLTAHREEAGVVISVRDNGIGLPPEMLPRVFDLFQQVEQGYSRSQGGLGIGLTLARSLVEMHGGSIEARSDGVGRGSEFVIRLPLSAVELEGHHRIRRDDGEVVVGPHRVLVVDDNRDAADSLSLLLRNLGAEVLTARDGPTALEAFGRFRPTVMVLDIGMPGMDGYELARRARQHPEGSAVTLIALTGWGQANDHRRSMEAGIDHHLIKPLDLAALEEVLASVARESGKGRAFLPPLPEIPSPPGEPERAGHAESERGEKIRLRADGPEDRPSERGHGND
jgi:signal transduction histidine kinase